MKSEDGNEEGQTTAMQTDRGEWPTGEVAQVVEGIRRLLGLKLIGEVYADLLQPPARSLGSGTGKLLSLVLDGAGQALVATGSKLKRIVGRIEERVPEDRLIAAPPEIAGPVLEGIRYLNEGSPLFEMFEQLLISACDRDALDNVHPAFPEVIKQLSAQEALLFQYIASDTKPRVQARVQLRGARVSPVFDPQKVLLVPPALSAVLGLSGVGRRCEHLEALHLIMVEEKLPQPPRRLSPDRMLEPAFGRASLDMLPTYFGQLFYRACIPPAGFALYREIVVDDHNPPPTDA